MLDLAFGILSAAAVLGALLIVAQQRGRAFARISMSGLGAMHGLIGATGVIVLLLGWQEGDVFGKAGVDALVLLGAGLLGGLTVALLAWKRGGAPGGLIAMHALVAGLGYLLLAGFTLG
jgi:hypothetical protein